MGLPDHVTDTNTISDNFCEDCVNVRLTWAPHSRPATHIGLQGLGQECHGTEDQDPM